MFKIQFWREKHSIHALTTSTNYFNRNLLNLKRKWDWKKNLSHLFKYRIENPYQKLSELAQQADKEISKSTDRKKYKRGLQCTFWPQNIPLPKTVITVWKTHCKASLLITDNLTLHCETKTILFQNQIKIWQSNSFIKSFPQVNWNQPQDALAYRCLCSLALLAQISNLWKKKNCIYGSSLKISSKAQNSYRFLVVPIIWTPLSQHTIWHTGCDKTEFSYTTVVCMDCMDMSRKYSQFKVAT